MDHMNGFQRGMLNEACIAIASPTILLVAQYPMLPRGSTDRRNGPLQATISRPGLASAMKQQLQSPLRCARTSNRLPEAKSVRGWRSTERSDAFDALLRQSKM